MNRYGLNDLEAFALTWERDQRWDMRRDLEGFKAVAVDVVFLVLFLWTLFFTL